MPSDLTTRTKAGLVVASLLGVADCTSLAFPPTAPGEEGPPTAILVLDVALGVVTLVAVAVAWYTSRRSAVRVAAGARVLSAITALPAFFVDVPPALKLIVAAFVVVTLVAVLLMLAPARRPVTVVD